MATIKAIEARSVHQIQSGQVIVDLSSVVKELVENSLDAGATSIEVRFKNQGLSGIEVQDNGKGIAADDFESVALKHYTSKLSNYEDLGSLDTFGFRGEALSSLCALSHFHVITARAEDGAVGKRLDFEISGKLGGVSVQAAPRGTTVAVEELFFNLPVRRKELEKNIKREYNKVVSLLYAYACIAVGVRLSVSNQMPKGKKTSVFTTNANPTTKENIANVFGAKTLSALVPLDLSFEMQPSSGFSTQGVRGSVAAPGTSAATVIIQGHISKPIFGEGRQTPDRQMLFVNSRPCQLPQVTKAFNEVYKTFNITQSPFIFANLVMDTNSYDVNVSPDKRVIMLHDQTALLDSLKAALVELFERTDQTVPQSQAQSRRLPSFKPLAISRRESTAASLTAEEDESDGDSDGSEMDVVRDKSASTVDGIGNSRAAVPSLVQSWAERNTHAREEIPAARRKSLTVPAGINGSAFRSARQLVQTSEADQPAQTRDTRLDVAIGTADDGFQQQSSNVPKTLAEPDPLSSPYGDLFTQKPLNLQQRVNDLTALIHRDHHDSMSSEKKANANDKDSLFVDEQCEQPQIPSTATPSPSKTPGPVQNAFDRMRPKRTPIETAHITIGDETTTTTIGSGSLFKRRRIHNPNDSQTISRFVSSPLLARGLQSFAATDSDVHIDDHGASVQSQHFAKAVQEESDEDGNGNDDDDDDQLDPASDDDGVDDGLSDTPTSSQPDDSEESDTQEVIQLSSPSLVQDDASDAEYVDEEAKKLEEEAKVAKLVMDAELNADRPTDANLKRAAKVLRNGIHRKDSTLHLAQGVAVTADAIKESIADLGAKGEDRFHGTPDPAVVRGDIADTNAEARLSLTVSKADFERMKIIGQFNVGFILAVRPASDVGDEDQLFIIDQHAADEKYNYERLQRTAVIQSQRLVRPKPLELTAVEEEIVLSHAAALKANGFEIETPFDTNSVDDNEGNGLEPHADLPATTSAARRTCQLLTLPISGEKTFDLSDLEELLHLLSETPHGSSSTTAAAAMPRPRKVQRLLAMRACRSSIMVGRTLTARQMLGVVRHMGDMEKPWNCPHGRPTMRHLASLGAWNGWKEGDASGDDERNGESVRGGRTTDWSAWLSSRRS